MGQSFSYGEASVAWAYAVNDTVKGLVRSRDATTQQLKDLLIKVEAGARIESGSLSTGVQVLSTNIKNTDEIETNRLVESIASLSDKVDKVDKKFDAEGDRLGADIISHATDLDRKIHALSVKVDEGLQGTTGAINKGLAIGLSVGLGVPLIALAILCFIIHKGRRYDQQMLYLYGILTRSLQEIKLQLQVSVCRQASRVH
jgi:predicted nuclease with TOPRIM domain